MQELLARQLELCRRADGTIDHDKLLGLVEGAYQDDARAKSRLERAIRLMSEEMEEARKDDSRLAMASLTRFLNASRYPLLTTTKDWRVVFANEPASLAFGYTTTRDLLGINLADVFHQSDRLKELLDKSVLVLTLNRVDGSQIVAELSCTSVSLGEDVFNVISLRHQTEQVEREAALERAKLVAEQANAQKSRFLATMSHELRTPLNAVIGYAEMLEEDLQYEGLTQLHSDAQKIKSAGRHLLGLINQVLDLSKIEAGSVELEHIEYDPSELVREIVDTTRHLVEKNGNRLAVSARGLPTSFGDPTRLRQCLFNLVSNAAKFTKDGIVSLEATAEDDNLIFTVKDTGIGMTEAQMGRIFEPFAQADESTTRQFGGTGLGLTITRKLARLMGGEINVTSVPNEGSAFTLTIGANRFALTEEVAAGAHYAA